jgi:hypothetical protein
VWHDLYAENDAGTRRNLESLANSVSHFREAIHHIAESQGEPLPISQQLEKARQRQQSSQRRVILEWAAAMAVCVALLLPGIGYFQHRAAHLREQQRLALEQREADAALLDQVANEVSEGVPDSMRPLAELDTDYTSSQISLDGTENNNGTE